jgi:hypothetical protein
MANVTFFSPDGGTTRYPFEDTEARSRLTTVESALAGKQDTLTFDNSPTENSTNPVKSGGVYTALAGKQDMLTFDNAPTANSNNPVKSGGVYTAVGVWTSAVSCAVGDTTATISNASIHTTSSIRLYAQTSSGAVVGYTSIAVTEGQAVVTFAAALEEAASIKLQIFN